MSEPPHYVVARFPYLLPLVRRTVAFRRTWSYHNGVCGSEHGYPEVCL